MKTIVTTNNPYPPPPKTRKAYSFPDPDNDQYENYKTVVAAFSLRDATRFAKHYDHRPVINPKFPKDQKPKRTPQYDHWAQTQMNNACTRAEILDNQHKEEDRGRYPHSFPITKLRSLKITCHLCNKPVDSFTTEFQPYYHHLVINAHCHNKTASFILKELDAAHLTRPGASLTAFQEPPTS